MLKPSDPMMMMMSQVEMPQLTKVEKINKHAVGFC